jgi:CheY-like chemotaxis protein
MARILIAEDELILALNIEMLVREGGHEVAGPVSSPAAALRLVADGDIEAALLDVRLRCAELVYPVCDALTETAIPFAFMTAYEHDVIPTRYRSAMILHKPFAQHDVMRVLRALLAATSRTAARR